MKVINLKNRFKTLTSLQENFYFNDTHKEKLQDQFNTKTCKNRILAVSYWSFWCVYAINKVLKNPLSEIKKNRCLNECN